MYEQPELPEYINDCFTELDDLRELMKKIRAKVDAALTPTFVPVHAHEKLMEIGEMLHKEGY